MCNIKDNNRNSKMTITANRASNLKPRKKDLKIYSMGKFHISSKKNIKKTILKTVSIINIEMNICNEIQIRSGSFFILGIMLNLPSN